VYLTANYDLRQIQLALAVTDGVMAPDLISFDHPSSAGCPSSTVDHWFIGVIVLACILAIVLVIFSIYLFERQRGEKARIKAVIKENEPLETSLPQHPVEADGKVRHGSTASELSSDGILAMLARTWSKASSKFDPEVTVPTVVSTRSTKGQPPAELADLNQTMGDSAHQEQMV
jgi:hypothetical protein